MKEKKESIVEKIIKDGQIIGVIGLAKNTGKTTTLNYMIEKIESKTIGLTSIGLDGESLDQVNFLPKPKIKVRNGMIVATAQSCLDICNLSYEVLFHTGFHTAIGEIKIIRVLSEGYLMIAGPTSNKELHQVITMMKNYASMMMIDGAFNRMTFSNIPELDHIILASGASFHPNMEETILRTSFIVSMFQSEITKEQLEFKHPIEIKTIHELYVFDNKKNQTIEPILKEYRQQIQAIYIKGALTERLIHLFIKEELENLTIIIDDPSKCLIHHHFNDYFYHRKIKFEVLKSSKISCVTLNPWSPNGIHYDPIIFMNKMKEKINIPVFNVLSMEDYHV